MSETFLIGSILAIVGGYLDAHTYITRGHVFANAETGNMVLLGMKFAEKDYKYCLYYAIPILSFALGVLVAEYIKRRSSNLEKFHWRQFVIVFEIIMLVIISFISTDHNLIANSIVSFVCSLQVQSFRKLHGRAYATTMCTGNLRSATECLNVYLTMKDKKQLHNCFRYLGIISFFIVGGIIGTFMSFIWGTKSSLFVCIPLLIVFGLMFKEQTLFS